MQLLVPDWLVDSVTSAGAEKPGWPFTDVVPGELGGLAVGPATGISYFADQDGGLWAINPDASCRWHFDGDFIFGNPALGSDGTLYVTSPSTLYAFGDGNVGCDTPAVPAWRFDLGKQIQMFPGAAVGATKIWVVASDGNAYGVAK